MKVKTSELSGVQLDYAVAVSNGMKIFSQGINGNWPGNAKVTEESLSGKVIILDMTNKLWVEQNLHAKPWSPSADWSQCGEIMESMSISCYQSSDPATGKIYHWVGVNESVAPGRRKGMIADNPRVAICRAVVSAKLGDEVEIPDELMESKQ